MSQIPGNEKLFEFKWTSPPQSFEFDFRTTFTNAQPSLATKQKQSKSSSVSDHSVVPLVFSWNLKDDTKTSDVPNDQSMVFSFSPKPSPPKPKRRLKMPAFGLIETYKEKLHVLQKQITECESNLSKLKRRQSDTICDKKTIEKDIATWYANWKLWDEDDLMHWVFEEIDNGYFTLKKNINKDTKPFDVQQFTQQLSMTVHAQRFDRSNHGHANGHAFEGSDLKYFDILDVQQLFGFLNGDDCRKLFLEIEKLTKAERDKNKIKINQSCAICTVNKKQFVLPCGHIFCAKCVHKLKVCAFCKKSFNKSQTFKVFL
eukprot:135385_1